MENGGELVEYYYIDAKYIDSKNITFKFTANQYNMLITFGENKAIKLVEIIDEITDGTRVKREYTEGGVRIINISDFKNGSIYPYNIKSISKINIKEKDFVKLNFTFCKCFSIFSMNIKHNNRSVHLSY